MTVSNVGVNIAEKATLIWNVADMLRGPFKPHEYGLVILPMTVVKRFHDCLLPNHAKMLETFERFKHLEVVDGFLTRASGYQFYNTSRYTFETLLADNCQARRMQPDGTYVRLTPGDAPLNAQELFYQQAYDAAAKR